VDKLKMHSPDLTQQNIDKLAELFPTVVTERLDDDGNPARAIDFNLLRQELSDHLVDGPQERYQLDWPGKRAALFTANAPIAKTLRPVREESVDFDTTKNLFIEGDNLDALKLLQESYLGKVKLIYIDPPYNTGRDFIYRDDFAESTASYLERSQQVDGGVRLVANPESGGRFHSAWLSMMLPRLKLSRNLLADDGVIFISIDDGELANVSKLCDEVFGAANHVATFVWKSKSGGANDSGEVAVDHEYIVCYSRTAGANVLGLDPDAVATTSYTHEDEFGRYSLERLDKQNLQYSSSLAYDLVGPDGTIYRLNHRNPAQPNAIWRWSKDRVARDMDKLVFKDGNVYTKNYEKAGAKPRSLFVDERFGRTRTGSTELRALLSGSYFDNPKPTKLIEMIVKIASRTDSIVLDFFAGSGTTAHAVMATNAADLGQRRFITVQLPEVVERDSDAGNAGFETIAEISRRRLRSAGNALKEKLGADADRLDIGFRALRVDGSNMTEVLRSPDAVTQGSLAVLTPSVRPDRTALDLLFQVLLDWGLDLSEPIREEPGQFYVGDGALIACFESKPSSQRLRAIASLHPAAAVFLDGAFERDADLINLGQIFRELSPETTLRVI
jgi:adenine-specific DNA-methyltransferase